tara:strand:+ start:50 stop:553 length:504 start_codon:yes stop_codon:yes gene_type:complete
MKFVKNFVKEVKNHEIILGILMILYILSGVETPHEIAPYITSIFGYGILIVLAVLIFVGTNPILGLLVIITFLVLVYRSNQTHPQNVMPSDNYKNTVMKSLNHGNESILSNEVNIDNVFGGSGKPLEQEVVEKVVVVSNKNDGLDKPSYISVSTVTHGALDLTSADN